MQIPALSILSSLLLFTSSLAAPAPAAAKTVTLLLLGATPEAQATVIVPADGSTFKISKLPYLCASNIQLLTQCEKDHPELSVSHITVLGQATCTIKGKDGSSTFVAFRGTLSNIADVGPPQVQISGVCNGY